MTLHSDLTLSHNEDVTSQIKEKRGLLIEYYLLFCDVTLMFCSFSSYSVLSAENLNLVSSVFNLINFIHVLCSADV